MDTSSREISKGETEKIISSIFASPSTLFALKKVYFNLLFLMGR